MFAAILQSELIPMLLLAGMLATIVTIPLWGDPP